MNLMIIVVCRTLPRSSFFLIGLYIIGLAILTQDAGIAATISGSQCLRNLDYLLTVSNCVSLIALAPATISAFSKIVADTLTPLRLV